MIETLDSGSQEALGMPGTLDTVSKIEPETVYTFDSCTQMGHLKSDSEGELVSKSDDTKEKENMECSLRAEIDTSSPIGSVKEAASLFGGFGFWRPQHDAEEDDIAKVEEQAAKLEKDLIAKVSETLDVLKELKTTKVIVEELKSKLLQKEASLLNVTFTTNSTDTKIPHAVQEAEKENHENTVGGLSLCPSPDPSLILMELKQAKLNLAGSTNDLVDIRARVRSFNKKIERERISLEKTRERITLNSSQILLLKQELNQTRQKLQVARRLSMEAEQFKTMREAAKSEVSRTMYEIEQTKTRIKTTEIRLIAAKTMKEAASVSEAVALAEMKIISKNESSGLRKTDVVTLSLEKYHSLSSKAQDAEERCNRRIIDAMLQVDEANASKMGIWKTVEKATEEVKTSKKMLEEALKSADAANRGKLTVEEDLRKWRFEHSQGRRSAHNSAEFKNGCQSHCRRGSRMPSLRSYFRKKNWVRWGCKQEKLV